MSLDLYPGEQVGLIGPSGSGKSTALDLLGLVLRPDRAERFIFQTRRGSVDLAALWAQGAQNRLADLRLREMGYVLQTGGLLPFLTVRENMALTLRALGESGFDESGPAASGPAASGPDESGPDESGFGRTDLAPSVLGESVPGRSAPDQSAPDLSVQADRVAELAQRLDITRLLDAYPSRLSIGERQRVAIGRALAARPSFLLADEPTAALDPERAKKALDLLLELVTASGATLLLVTHDESLLKRARLRPLETRISEDNGTVRAVIADKATRGTGRFASLAASLSATGTSLPAEPQSGLSMPHAHVSAEPDPAEQDPLVPVPATPSIPAACAPAAPSSAPASVPCAPSVSCVSLAASAGSNLRRVGQVLGLALRDMAHERLLSLCGVLTLASVLAPLLILFGVRHGVISAMQERLLQDPAILTVLPAGSGAYTRDWIEAFARRPELAFAIPRTRDIAATIQLVAQRESDSVFARASLEPTAPGDPLLERAKAAIPRVPQAGQPDEVVLSAPLAGKLGVGTGDALTGQLGRRRAGAGLESANLPLRVVAVLPLAAEDRDVAFVTLPFLEDAESFRDAIAVPARGFAGDPPPPDARRYAGFRAYAARLEDVETLRALLAAQGIETVTRARDISFVQQLSRSLTLVFALIALTAAAGFAASTASGVLAAVRRKDKQLGLLRLIGFPGFAIMGYPVAQALCTGLLGTLLAALLYAGVSLSIDHLFADQLQGAAVCRLEPSHFALALGLVLMLSALASVQAAVRAARIEPSEVLREI